MSVYQIHRLGADCTAVLWEIEESEEELHAQVTLTVPEQMELIEITHPAQRVEWLACRAALRSLVQTYWSYAGLYKDEFGKPHLIGLKAHVSISHTSGWAAAVVHHSKAVGIDIEPFRDQFVRVVPRVLSDEEISHANGDLHRLAVYWCAKEALYKLYGKRQLTFREHLHVEPFADGAGLLTGHVRLPDDVRELKIHYFETGPGMLAIAF
ncbi:4'-phosphopantetheinyl transferase family protein [Larkinella rosea]|uniref:4'-phosphopantetheinyl transferase superfamily protein n=1 Tax=Larkinella rosea TaxID=2025312 RepID=A0A3P1B9G0_9BACT|nr:4'-phosphopantetheinyl transferase superfamily protein [Larkinella rosea]RRA97634.1 4'-phosphopantetheinyl transferase superfamily protein [Larkinella rosea]